MKTGLLSFILFLSLLCVQGQTSRKLLQLDVSGTPYQRGIQQGTRFKTEIAELLERWKKNIRQTLRGDADSLINAFVKQTDFLPAIRLYTPGLLEEVNGIAEGSGQLFRDIYAFQLPDEFWVWVDRMGKDTSFHHCSGIGIPGRKGSPAYVSQNMDVDSWMDGYQLVLHIKGERSVPEQYILTCPGLIGFNGMNEKGIGVCVNTLLSLRASATGLPVAFMVRALLGKVRGKDALSFLQNTPHASGQNYILGIRDSVYDFEASANRVTRFFPDSTGIVAHTNHALVNTDIKPWYANYYKAYLDGKTKQYNSETRLRSIQKRAAVSPSKDDGFIRETLRSKDEGKNPVCNANLPNRGFFTFGSVIMTLSKQAKMQVTAGPPDESDYQLFLFNQ